MSLIKANGPIPKQLGHGRRVPKKGPYKWQKPKLDPAESKYMEDARSCGCALSEGWGSECVLPMTFQHPQGLKYRGLASKGPVAQGFGLCTGHHTIGRHSITEMGIRPWEARYGPQDKHAAETRRRMKVRGLL